MSKIKVLEFVGSMNCGGAETMLMNIFRKFDKEKYEFTFMVNIQEKGWYDDEILALGGKIVRINKIQNGRLNQYINYLANLFIEGNYDVVHAHTFLHSGFVMKAAKKAGIKVRITHSHSAMDHFEKSMKYKFKKKYLQNLILKNANYLLACSTEAGECLFGKQFQTRGRIVKNSIRIDEIEKITDSKNLKDEYNIQESELILGHIGRFVEIKNHQFLLEIAKTLKEKNICFKMFLIGNGGLFEKVQEQCNQLGLKDNIIFTGIRDNVYEYINMFDIFLLPSLYEGLPLTAIEAQGFGVKSLISDKVSKEVDLHIDLVKFLPVDEKVEIWTEEIIEQSKNKIYKNKEQGISALKREGYGVESTIEALTNIYNGDGGKF
ncbi:MAG: glycosyltransferase family 1 protein [Clostridia bacterium]|nr:glycosyltransferase family 1 protein [Clostridia bacterium]